MEWGGVGRGWNGGSTGGATGRDGVGHGVEWGGTWVARGWNRVARGGEWGGRSVQIWTLSARAAKPRPTLKKGGRKRYQTRAVRGIIRIPRLPPYFYFVRHVSRFFLSQHSWFLKILLHASTWYWHTCCSRRGLYSGAVAWNSMTSITGLVSCWLNLVSSCSF